MGFPLLDHPFWRPPFMEPPNHHNLSWMSSTGFVTRGNDTMIPINQSEKLWEAVAQKALGLGAVQNRQSQRQQFFDPMNGAGFKMISTKSGAYTWVTDGYCIISKNWYLTSKPVMGMVVVTGYQSKNISGSSWATTPFCWQWNIRLRMVSEVHLGGMRWIIPGKS